MRMGRTWMFRKLGMQWFGFGGWVRDGLVGLLGWMPEGKGWKRVVEGKGPEVEGWVGDTALTFDGP